MDSDISRQHFMLQWRVAAALLLLVGAIVAFAEYHNRQEIMAREQERLLTQVRIVHKSLGSQIEATYRALRHIRTNLPRWRKDSADPSGINARLTAMEESIPGVRTLIVLDAGGMALASNREELIGRKFGTRSHFQVAHAANNANALHVLPPFETALGVWAIPVSISVQDDAGRFAGIVSATLDPEYFKTLLESVSYAPDFQSSVTHADGQVFLTDPPGEARIGVDHPGAPFARHRESNRSENIFIDDDSEGGETRLSALHTVAPPDAHMDKALIVSVSRDLQSIYAPWRKSAQVSAMLFLLIVASNIVGLGIYQNRTRRLGEAARSAQLALAEREERLALAIEGAGLGVWDWDLQTSALQINTRWAEMLGRPVDEIAPHISSWEHLVHPDDLPVARQAFDRHQRGEAPIYRAAHRLQHHDGSWVWVLSVGRLLARDAQGKPLRAAGIHLDISGSKAAEQALQAKEQRLSLLLSSMEDIVFVLDTSGRFSEFHWPANTDYPHPPAANYLGNDYATLFPADVADTIGAAITDLITDPQPINVEFSITFGDSTRFFHATFSPLMAESRWPVGFLCVARDITARRKEEALTRIAHAEIKRLSERNELLLNSAGEGIFGVDLDERCIFINPAALAMLGFDDARELLGRNGHDLFHYQHSDGSPYPPQDCSIFQTLRDGRRRRIEDDFTRKDGRVIPVQMTVTPMLEDDRIVGAEVVFQDISKRREMERELIRLATTDTLTGIANRRRFMEQLGMELERIKRFGKPATLLMLDIDFFKQVNDSRGHAAGDAVLRHFTARIQDSLRRIDLFGRLGGEEFGILLPGTPLDGALGFAERLRQLVAQTPIPVGDGEIRITVSIGAAEFDTDDPIPDSILARADVALYRAKGGGRNRVEAS